VRWRFWARGGGSGDCICGRGGRVSRGLETPCRQVRIWSGGVPKGEGRIKGFGVVGWFEVLC
jgi:hypothetical protein